MVMKVAVNGNNNIYKNKGQTKLKERTQFNILSLFQNECLSRFLPTY